LAACFVAADVRSRHERQTHMEHSDPNRTAGILWVAILCLLLSSGCRGLRQEAVFVDLDGIVASEPDLPAFAVARPQPPAPPAGIPPLIQPELPPRVLRAETGQRMAQARQTIRQQREQAYTQLLTRLREVYREEAERLHDQMLEALGPVREALVEEVRGRVRAAFDDYAAQRGPLLARLTMHAGMPDVDPLSTRIHAGDDLMLRAALEEAKRIRARLAALEAEHDGRVSSILAEADASIQARVQELSDELRRMRVDADRRAEAEAARQLRRHEEEVRVVLAERDEIRLPEVPARSYAGSPSPDPLPEQPHLSPDRILQNREERRALLEAEVRIWAGVAGYRVVEGPARAREATQEFLQWRQTHRPGP
jgi:hypothetical protein